MVNYIGQVEKVKDYQSYFLTDLRVYPVLIAMESIPRRHSHNDKK